MEQAFLPLHDLPFYVHYDTLDDFHPSSSKSLDATDDGILRSRVPLSSPQHRIPRAFSASILSSVTAKPLSVSNMSSTHERATPEGAESLAPTASPLSHAPDASNASSSSSAYSDPHACVVKQPSTRERIRAMRAEDEERVKKIERESKHSDVLSEEVFDEQPKAILDSTGAPYALGVAALESRYAAMKTNEKELPNPHVHRRQRDRERRRARRREPPAKPTPEQTALGKYRVAYECYDDEYRDEILTYMYKCMVRSSGLPLIFLTLYTG